MSVSLLSAKGQIMKCFALSNANMALPIHFNLHYVIYYQFYSFNLFVLEATQNISNKLLVIL